MVKLLTAKEISETLNIAESTVYAWVHDGFIPHYKLGRSVRFSEPQIYEWLKKREHEGRGTYKIAV